MTDYYAGYEIVAQTKNFMVTCEDDVDARQRAMNIAGICESDLAQLNDLFSTNFEVGNTSPHTIWIIVLKDDPTSNLVYQRGKPLKTVIQAGGSTLAETYAWVTGEPASAAFSSINGLLQAHIASSTTSNMRRDNIFPLLDAPFRSLDITQGDPIDKGDLTDPVPVSWEVRPGLMCHTGPYDFFRQRSLVEQPIYVRARGMANAAFQWTIAGIEPGGTQDGAWTTITVATPLTVKNPDGTSTHVADEVTLQYATASVWNGLVVYLKTPNWNGNCELTVTFSAWEAAVPGEPTVTANDTELLTTITWAPGQAPKDARKSCNPFYVTVNNTFWYLTSKLVDFKNRPDPPSPEGEVQEVVLAVERLQRAVAQYARAGHLGEAEVWRQLAIPGVLRSENAASAEVDMTRLQPQVQSLSPQTNVGDEVR